MPWALSSRLRAKERVILELQHIKISGLHGASVVRGRREYTWPRRTHTLVSLSGTSAKRSEGLGCFEPFLQRRDEHAKQTA